MSIFRRYAIFWALLTYALGLVPFYFLTPVHQGVQNVLQTAKRSTVLTPTLGPAAAPPTVAAGAPHVQPSLVAPASHPGVGAAAVSPTLTPASAVGAALPTSMPPGALSSAGAASPTALPGSAAPATGWLLYAARGDLWETNGNQTVQLTHNGHVSQPAFDGGSLVYVEREKNYSDLWLADSNGAPRRVTDNASAVVSANHWVTQPTLLPGGRAVDVLADLNKATTGDGDLAIWQLDLPSGSARQISHPPAYTGGDQDVAVDPGNADTIIFTRYIYGQDGQLSEGLYWLSPDSDQTIALTTPDHSSRQASFSPDGRALAFVQTDGHADNLYVGRVETTPQPQLVGVQKVASGTIAEPAWAPDATELAYVALTNRRFELWTRPITRAADGSFTFGAPRQMTNIDGIDAASRPVWLTDAAAASLPNWLGAGQ